MKYLWRKEHKLKSLEINPCDKIVMIFHYCKGAIYWAQHSSKLCLQMGAKYFMLPYWAEGDVVFVEQCFRFQIREYKINSWVENLSLFCYLDRKLLTPLSCLYLFQFPANLQNTWPAWSSEKIILCSTGCPK